MVQESIVEYINTQMKAGVSRDTIKTTLVGAGWVPADVEETLKKVEAAKMAQPIAAAPAMPAMPAMSSPVTKPVAPATSMGMGATPGAGMGMGMGSGANPPPQTIKVSDLVSSSTFTSPVMKPSAMPLSKSPLTGPSPASAPVTMNVSPAAGGAKAKDAFPAAASYPAARPQKSHGALITDAVLVIIIIAVGGFAGFLYMQNNSLNARLSSLNGQSSGVNSQLSDLQAQVAASTTALTAQVASLASETQELQTELSFYAAPTGTAPGATSTATLSGTVSLAKTGYIITATYGAKIPVVNSRSAAVIAALTPLMATATSTAPASASSTASAPASSTAPTVIPATPAATAQFTGTYTRGVDSITLTAVNGTSVQ